MIGVTVKGRAVSVAAELDGALLWVLREHLRLTGRRLRHMPFTPARVRAALAW